ncbi:MAG TPA: hypothetical protein V6D47_00660 [Oscillatoriaceae cyanobacterium]
MSKSRKKQQARKRAEDQTVETVELLGPGPDEEPALALPEKRETALHEALYTVLVEAATRVGVMREEGEQLAYVYNGDTISLKYVEPGEEGQPATLMVAAFRQGVVYQAHGETQLVYKPGEWEQAIAALASTEPADEDDAPED